MPPALKHGKAMSTTKSNAPTLLLATSKVQGGRRVNQTRVMKPEEKPKDPSSSLTSHQNEVQTGVPFPEVGNMQLNYEAYDSPPAPKTSKNQNDYLRDFLELKPKFVKTLLDRHAGPQVPICQKCKAHKAIFRCRTCFAAAPQCRGCIRAYHYDTPFHRIERWNGTFYEKAALWQIGLRLIIPNRSGCDCMDADAIERLEKDKDKRYRVMKSNNRTKVAGARAAQKSAASTLPGAPSSTTSGNPDPHTHVVPAGQSSTASTLPGVASRTSSWNPDPQGPGVPAGQTSPDSTLPAVAFSQTSAIPTDMHIDDADFEMADADEYDETMTIPQLPLPEQPEHPVMDQDNSQMHKDKDFAVADHEDYVSDEDGTLVGAEDEQGDDLEHVLAEFDDDPGDTECLDEEPGERLGKGVPQSDVFGHSFITIVDSSGLHYLPLVICRCQNSEEQVLDCVSAGLLPTSYKKISTVFTEQCLDEARLANLEAKTTPYQYYHYLRRLTNPAFPATVSERYAELRRMMREWRIMKREMWAGTHMSHPSDEDISMSDPSSLRSAEDNPPQDGRPPPPAGAPEDISMSDPSSLRSAEDNPPQDGRPPPPAGAPVSRPADLQASMICSEVNEARPVFGPPPAPKPIPKPGGMNVIRLDNTGRGILSLFCPACPQPGINLHIGVENIPENEKFVLDPDQTVDGNFSADHIMQPKSKEDIALLGGRGMLTPNEPYNTVCKLAALQKDEKTNEACEHNFRAITQATRTRSDCDVTGICGVACARHGCFAPQSVSNLQKGERYVNVDWSVVQAIIHTNVGPGCRVKYWYDIFCQWSKNWQKRLDASNNMMSLPPGVRVDGGIGLFHVHGHEDKCFRRFASYFVPGAAIVDGEVLETLWSVLNLISRSTRTATLAHREEILDDHMNDNNWKKLVGMVSRLVKKFKTAAEQSAQTAEYLSTLTKSAPSGCEAKWTKEIEKAEAEREKSKGLSMDILQPKTQKKTESQIDVQVRLIKEFPGNSAAAAHLVEGLKLEIEQLQLGIHISRFGVNPSKNNRIDIASLRDNLMKRILKFHERGLEIMGTSLSGRFAGQRPPIPVFQSESDEGVHVQADGQAPALLDVTTEDDIVRDAFVFAAEHDTPAERVLIRLPSSLPTEMLAPHLARAHSTTVPANVQQPGSQLALETLMMMELQLRKGVLNDTLQDIRIAISSMSFQYTKDYRKQKTKAPKTRSRTAIDELAKGISHTRRVYDLNRQRLIKLGVKPEEIKEIRNADIRVNTNIVRPNVHGNVRGQLSWIFRTGSLEGDNRSDEEVLAEYFRVHWLYGRAMKMRWAEEYILVKYEMRWTWIFFTRKADEWEKLAKHSTGQGEMGQSAYAHKQASLWRKLARSAAAEFKAANPDFKPEL